MKPTPFIARTIRIMGCILALAAAPAWAASPQTTPATPRRNVIIFVADGLRHDAPDTGLMPTYVQLRKAGVNFTNSHSIFPTATTPNASVIATGHYLGDTGNYGNGLFLGYPASAADDYAAIHDVESDLNIPDVNEHFSGNYLGEESLLSLARKAGYHTAVIGKYGPVLIQDVTRNNVGITAANIGTIIMDDATGFATPSDSLRGPVPLPAAFSRRLTSDPNFKHEYFDDLNLTTDPHAPSRSANNATGTKVANTSQQKYYIDVLTRAVLPTFTDPKGERQPFVVIYWSRDPDGTQHNQTDGPGLAPGINGPTAHLAFQNVDNNLKQLLEYLRATPDPITPTKKLSDTTNLFITSDHGFGTVSRGVMDAKGTRCQTFATAQRYANTNDDDLPPGFIAIDLAHDLNLPLYDAAQGALSEKGIIQYRPLKLPGPGGKAEYPSGAALIGGAGTYDKDGFAANLIVVGGAIYAPAQRVRDNKRPDPAPDLIKKAVAALAAKPYISGIFVDAERFGDIPGALSLADIHLQGSARTPVPAIMVNCRSFATDPKNPNMTGVEISDTSRAQGQGQHGTFGRHDTFNCMFAVGPDFKLSFSDPDPVSNADITPTLAHILGLPFADAARGRLTGRILTEALANGPAPRGSTTLRKQSLPTPPTPPAAAGISTVLLYQSYTDETGRTHIYLDAAGFPGATNGL